MSDGENTFTAVDFLTNGFQVITSNALYNNNGNTYLYWAIAADPSTAATPTVTKSFDVVSYDGNASTQDIESDISPDFIWIFTTSHANYSNPIFDSVRGKDDPQAIYSDRTLAESNDGLTAFNEKGFSIDNSGNVNASGKSFVAYLWSAGSHEGNLPTINTEGTISSTTSTNDASGFSIVRYSGNGGSNQSIGHGLSNPPELVLFKRIDSNVNWFVFVKIGSVYQRFEGLNNGNAAASVTYFSASSTTISWSGTTSDFNGDNNEYIMYCFKATSGHSAIGYYDGNSSSQTIYTTDDGTSSGNNPFAPSFLLVKETNNSSYSSWRITDRVRGQNNLLFPDTDSAQDTNGTYARLNDNGFTQLGLDSNVTGQRYFYYAVK